MDDENKRIEIDDLPRAAEELTADEAKKVTGGRGTVTFSVDGISQGGRLFSL